MQKRKRGDQRTNSFFKVMEQKEKYNNILKMNGFINCLSYKDNEPYIITIN
jgi:hypothetical protein